MEGGWDRTVIDGTNLGWILTLTLWVARFEIFAPPKSSAEKSCKNLVVIELTNFKMIREPIFSFEKGLERSRPRKIRNVFIFGTFGVLIFIMTFPLFVMKSNMDSTKDHQSAHNRKIQFSKLVK
jgi:hypothetical protein